jgi:hypothetical protein
MPLSLGAITSAKAIVEQRTVEFIPIKRGVSRALAKKGCVNFLV